MAALAAGTLTACSAAGDTEDGSAGAGAGPGHHHHAVQSATTGGVDDPATLTVASAAFTGQVSGYSPSNPGDRFLVVTATLSNQSATPPLIASYSLFSVKTVDHHVSAG